MSRTRKPIPTAQWADGWIDVPTDPTIQVRKCRFCGQIGFHNMSCYSEDPVKRVRPVDVVDPRRRRGEE